MQAHRIEASPHYLRQELETQLTSNPDMWAFFQESVLDGIWYWDLEKPENEWMSPEFWQLFGVDPQTKRHDPAEWQDIIFPEDLKIAQHNFQAHLDDPDHPYDQTVRYRKTDGTIVWVRCRGLAIRDDHGKPVRMLGAHHDVTAIKQAQETARALLDANRELSSFAYATSHDLKSPLNTLRLLLGEIVESGALHTDQEAQGFLDLAFETLERMGELVQELVSYSGVAGGATELENVPLGPALEGVIADMRSDIETCGAAIHRGSLPTVRGNPAQLRMLLQNLIDNAIKFRAPDGPHAVPPQISITGRTLPDGTAQILVTDNGIGIDPAHHDRIFNMFHRLHRDDDYVGHGLGLGFCRRIVENHGGSITVESVPGEGSVFIVTLRSAQS